MTIVVVLAAIAAISAACIPPPEETTPEVVVTASTLTVGYGDEIPALDPSYGAITPTVEATCSTTATQGSPAGDYPTTCEGALRSGHTIRYIAGTLTIAPASVTVTASDATMDFGGSVPAITATYSGLVGITQPAVLGRAPPRPRRPAPPVRTPRAARVHPIRTTASPTSTAP